MLHSVCWFRRLAFVLSVVALVSSAVEAQAQTGSISGVLRDSSGLALPGVTVTLVNEASKTESTTVSG